jgi:hypothetical protein
MAMCMKQILFALFTMVSFSSLACKCQYYSKDEQFRNAQEVLYVQIISTKYIENAQPFREVKATYKTLEAFKSSRNSLGFVTEGNGNCSIGLMSGHYYILYISADRIVSKCNGSTYFLDNDSGKKELEQLRGRKAI